MLSTIYCIQNMMYHEDMYICTHVYMNVYTYIHICITCMYIIYHMPYMWSAGPLQQSESFWPRVPGVPRGSWGRLGIYSRYIVPKVRT